MDIPRLVARLWPGAEVITAELLARNTAALVLRPDRAAPIRCALKWGRPGDRRIEKEVILYRDVLSPERAATPRLLAGQLDEECAILLLEWLDDAFSYFDPTDDDQTRRVYRAIAAMHRGFEDDAGAVVRAGTAQRWAGAWGDRLYDTFADGQGYRHQRHELARAFGRFAAHGDRLLATAPSLAAELELDERDVHRLAALADAILDELLEARPTLLHGDLHRWNIRLRRVDSGHELRLFDFGFAGIGAPQLDLAYVLADPLESVLPVALHAAAPATFLHGAPAQVALAAYHDAIQDSLSAPPSRAAFLRRQRLVNLYNGIGLCCYLVERQTELHSVVPLLAILRGIAMNLDLW